MQIIIARRPIAFTNRYQNEFTARRNTQLGHAVVRPKAASLIGRAAGRVLLTIGCRRQQRCCSVSVGDP